MRISTIAWAVTLLSIAAGGTVLVMNIGGALALVSPTEYSPQHALLTSSTLMLPFSGNVPPGAEDPLPTSGTDTTAHAAPSEGTQQQSRWRRDFVPPGNYDTQNSW
jgi:hypothetical protein